ncbi:MAG: sulfatase [Pseudomonadota bacterium]
MDRRTFLQRSALGLALTAAGVTGCLKAPSPKKTNVLFIAIDDLNSWIGCLSHLREGIPTARTPCMDRLAAQGVLFSNAHTPVPWCMPARNNLFAGLYANQSGMFVDELIRDLLPAIKTLPQHFMQHGYSALAAGKLFHDTQPERESWSRLEQFNRPPSQKAQKPRLTPVPGLEGADNLDWGQIALPEAEFADVKIADRVIQHLQAQHDRPFFIGAGFRFPHLPWYLPKEFLDRYPLESITLPWVKDDDLEDVPAAGQRIAFDSPFVDTPDWIQSDHHHITRANAWKKAVQAYLAAVEFADAQVGRIVDALDAGAHAQDTHVVLWSDNGFHLGEKLHWRKFTLWDQATRVPMMIRAADRRAAGKVVDEAVSLVDLYPTLVDMCGLPLPGHKLSGESLAPYFGSAEYRKTSPSIITYGKGNDSVVDERWRYIRYADDTEELYDHASDPNEWTNLAGVSRWAPQQARLSAWLGEVRA